MSKVLIIVFSTLTLIFLVIAMGLFDLFKRKSSENGQSAKDISHVENWATYLSTIDSTKVGSILVDLGIKDIAPIQGKSERLIVEVSYSNSRKNGLPVDSEFEKLREIEDSVVTEFAKESALFVGRLYCDGRMDMYLYAAPGTNAERSVADALSRYPAYPFKLRKDDDPNWETYLDFIYPSPMQLRSIQNDLVIQNLIKHGDLLEKKRQVDHWIYFPKFEDRDRFLSAIEGKGFRVEGMRKIEEDDGRPFMLNISRTDAVTPEATDDYILELWTIAKECNGEYDGWETFIVKE